MNPHATIDGTPSGGSKLCGWCGQPVRGSASIGDVDYCHPDYTPGEQRTCYMQASHATTFPPGRRERFRRFLFGAGTSSPEKGRW